MQIQKTGEFKAVTWAANSNIYEVNLRQYTQEGNFRAFASHFPRLKNMGIEILWLMPITPISRFERLGSLGSYYACSDYCAINPEYGDLDDFKWFVENAHAMGFKVIIDWVANHTGWDHRWTQEHPDFYRRNFEGMFYDAHGWRDVIDLNYDNPELKSTMIDCMKFWIEQVDIDGFRCDMAMLVPLDFWREARNALDKLKPLFWLAECEEVAYHEVFDLTYTWKWLHTMEEYWRHAVGLHGLYETLGFYRDQFPFRAMRAYFTSNHDENSHSGSEYERLGEAALPFAVLCCLYDGLPLIYSGQEIPNKKRLLFFDKDQIDWTESVQLHEFYKTLLTLRKTNRALTAGIEQTAPEFLSTNATDKVLCFIRRFESDEVLVVLNLSHENLSVEITSRQLSDYYNDLFNPSTEPFVRGNAVPLDPWSFKVYIR